MEIEMEFNKKAAFYYVYPSDVAKVEVIDQTNATISDATDDDLVKKYIDAVKDYIKD